MATSNDSTTYVGGYSTTAASNVPPDSGATGKRYQGAAEIRQLKKVLKDTFPSVTGAVTATHTQLNQLATNTFTGSFTSPGIDDNANAVAVTIDSSENVGIGTTSPDCKLDVAGFTKLGDSANAPQIKTIEFTGTVGAAPSTTTVTTGVAVGKIVSVNVLVADSSGNLYAPGFGGTANFVFGVDSSGDIGITVSSGASSIANQAYRAFLIYKA